jgi:hypothetical protein
MSGAPRAAPAWARWRQPGRPCSPSHGPAQRLPRARVATRGRAGSAGPARRGAPGRGAARQAALLRIDALGGRLQALQPEAGRLPGIAQRGGAARQRGRAALADADRHARLLQHRPDHAGGHAFRRVRVQHGANVAQRDLRAARRARALCWSSWAYLNRPCKRVGRAEADTRAGPGAAALALAGPCALLARRSCAPPRAASATRAPMRACQRREAPHRRERGRRRPRRRAEPASSARARPHAAPPAGAPAPQRTAPPSRRRRAAPAAPPRGRSCR